MSLSKLHVRFIQSQKQCYLSVKSSKSLKLPIAQLYVKDTNNFYLVLNEELISQNDAVTVEFKEKTPALNTLKCNFTAIVLDDKSEDHEDALLFFQVDEDKIKQIILLTLNDLSDS